ncbi:OsmC family protein [Arenibacter latericius]|uniref:OsmC family protein n=1 Tax=Arenibacter latericius TaxID=86104 RepID=UPI000401B0F8|nr:OsmC family protein [Arenibacter latericius]MDX1364559.1 OsmC family protein [Arenibacter latericius]
MTSKVTYLGDLRTSCEHLLSGNSFVTDAPLDNHGLGQAFSPTDTIATGLASCMFSVMGIKARSLEVDLVDSTAEVTKFMEADPRRIVRIDVKFKLPKNISEKNRKILENTARTCPVHYSLHPDIVRNISFHWEF